MALRDGVLPPELNVFTNIGSCIVVTRVEALRLPVEALDKEPSWSCATCSRGPYAQARALACVGDDQFLTLGNTDGRGRWVLRCDLERA